MCRLSIFYSRLSRINLPLPVGANAAQALRYIGECKALDARPHDGLAVAFRDSGRGLVASVAELHSGALHHRDDSGKKLIKMSHSEFGLASKPSSSINKFRELSINSIEFHLPFQGFC